MTYTAEQCERRAKHLENAGILDVAAMLRAYAADLRERETAKGGLLQRAFEVVHHEHDCPAIGGSGDDDCRCDAVPFLRDLEAVLPMAGKVEVPEADFTREEVTEAMELLRHYRSSIPTECLDQMECVLLSAAPTPPTSGEKTS